MDFKPSAKELSHFPFLKKAQDHIKTRFSSLETVLQDPKSEALIAQSVLRIQESITKRKTSAPPEVGSADEEITAYALARILVSCLNDRQMIDRLTRHEAERAYYFLVNEEEWNRNYKLDDSGYSRLCIRISDELGIRISQDRMPLADYVEIVAPLHEDRFKLVNRRLERGYVFIKKDERYELLRERIRLLMRRDLPHKVPPSICEHFSQSIGDLKKTYQEHMLRQFGTIEETAFPPCMQALVTALTAGTNLTHAGRFALTTFVHAIGMDITGIAQLYARSPDFDPEKTMYQVEHITGRGGSCTEYTTPACAAMRTTGLCVNSDGICERVNHPLSYYTLKKKGPRKNMKKAE